MATILVIEDEEVMRESLEELLELEDFSVITAENGDIGYQKAVEYHPDIIISDIAMPVMDGYTLLERLKSNEVTSTIPLIFLSAKADSRDIRNGMQLGADDYITKPFQRKDLFAAINSRLDKVSTISKITETKISEVKEYLATVIPHELRTPLNGILSISQYLIENPNVDKKELLWFHQSLNSSAKRLNRLIMNYLYYTETEVMKKREELLETHTDVRTENVGAVIINVVQQVAKQYASENFITTKLVDADIKIDNEYFIKVCEELIDNAFKFSKYGQEVFVSSQIKGDCYHLTIMNQVETLVKIDINKVGAYQQEKRHIFEQQGSGMGLVIVKNIMQIIGGKIEIINSEQHFCAEVIFPLA